ncbi:MAG: hypothetical protein OXG13_23030 [Gemmatimonadaceae bacterium]|nr:hypothetical protein [Gemmatimonadaceae bacterium]
MPERPSFSHFLIGAAAFERPSFLYAYLVTWLHLLVSVPILVFGKEVALLAALPPMAVSSVSLGVLVYGLAARRHGLLVNLLPYAVGLRRALDPPSLDYVFLLVAVVISLTSVYLVLSDEYRRFTREQGGGERGPPLGVTLGTGAAILLLLIYGIHLPLR